MERALCRALLMEGRATHTACWGVCSCSWTMAGTLMAVMQVTAVAENKARERG